MISSVLFNKNLFKKKPTLSMFLRAMASPMLLTVQLSSSFYFGTVLNQVSDINELLAPFFCLLYPYYIGL